MHINHRSAVSTLLWSSECDVQSRRPLLSSARWLVERLQQIWSINTCCAVDLQCSRTGSVLKETSRRALVFLSMGSSHGRCRPRSSARPGNTWQSPPLSFSRVKTNCVIPDQFEILLLKCTVAQHWSRPSGLRCGLKQRQLWVFPTSSSRHGMGAENRNTCDFTLRIKD